MEAMELEHATSQAAQDLNDGEDSGRNTRTPVQRETNRELDNQTSRAEGGVLEECVYERRPHDKST